MVPDASRCTLISSHPECIVACRAPPQRVSASPGLPVSEGEPLNETDSLRSTRHFFLSRSLEGAPESWFVKSLSGWHLAHPSDSRVWPLVDQSGGTVGWLLGEAIVPAEKGRVEGPLRLGAEAGSEALPAVLESLLDGLVGRFVGVLLDARTRRIYLDAGGSLPVMYAPATGIAASISGLLPAGPASERKDGLTAALDVRTQDQWFPFGLTPRADVFRLLPNHFLSLDDFQSVRHWPKAPPESGRGVGTLLQAIADRLRDSFASLAGKGDVFLSLTGGRDTRALLGAARPFLARTHCFTLGPRFPVDQVDLEVAEYFARRFRLNHVVLKPSLAEPSEVEQYFRVTSSCVTQRPFIKSKPSERAAGDRPVILGLTGAVGRGDYWHPGDLRGGPLTNLGILHRMRMPAVSPLPEMARRFLDEVSSFDPFTALDLLYIEQRQGCWAGPASAALDYAGGMFPLFCDREFYSHCIGLPPPYRQSRRLSRDLILMLWPELVDVPFNGEAEEY